MIKKYEFSLLFKKANILSFLLFLIAVGFIMFKGLNYGIDFKGGTLIELRTESKNISVSDIEVLRINQILSEKLSPKDAAGLTSRITSKKKNEVYQMVLKARKK